MSAMPVAPRPYSHHNMEELLELHNPDYCSLTSTPIPICQGPPSFMPNSKETDLTGELLNNNRNLTFTEFLSDNSDHLLEYDCYSNSCAQATTCSSPDSECTTFAEKHENFDYWPSFYTMTSPTADLSVNPANITATAAAPNAPITPIASPHDQSPVLQSSDLPSPLMHTEREVPDVLRAGMMQQPEDYQQMVNIPATPPKTPGKSRGRRMSNKPTKPGTKCFECTYSECGRVFKRSEHLKRHVRSIHTLERPFHCPYPHCAKRFSRSDNLSQHIRVHRPNGKDKTPQARPFSNFTPYMESPYPNTTTIPQ